MRRKQRNPRRAADPIYVDDVPVSTVLSELRSENTRLRKNIELSLQVQSAMQDRIGEISRERDQLVAITKQYNRAFSGYPCTRTGAVFMWQTPFMWLPSCGSLHEQTH